ncbi:hypothetical protein ACFL3V_05655, partial [Nanoarchaeota archaeon]
MRYVLVLMLSVLLFGCAGVPSLTYTTNASIAGGAVLPFAYSSEAYSATVIGQGGTGPYTCRSGAIGGTLTVSRDCVISGTAPAVAVAKTFPFSVNLTDANGHSSLLSLDLLVKAPPVVLELDSEIGWPIGEKHSYSFCQPAGSPCVGGVTPMGGKSPYTFTLSGGPMGLFMGVDGVLSGTVPEAALRNDYSLEVCAKDVSGEYDCGTVVLKLIEKKTFVVDTSVTGHGTDPGKILGCDDCDSVEEGSVVVLTASPSEGSNFVKWTGDCKGRGTCKLTVDSDKSVVAVFSKKTHWEVFVRGYGSYSDSAYGISYGQGGRFKFDVSG